jgi:hypothetical protein
MDGSGHGGNSGPAEAQGDSGRRTMERTPTFSTSTAGRLPTVASLTADTLITRVFGSRNVPNQRVSESLDYEPVQNKIFYERMRQAKKERHLFGCVAVGANMRVLHDSCRVVCVHPEAGPACRHKGMHASAACRAACAMQASRHTRVSPALAPNNPARSATAPVLRARCCRYTGHTLAKFVITLASGVLTGVFAVILSTSVGALTEWKLHTVQTLLQEPGSHRVWIAFLWNWAFSCVLVVFGVALVRLVRQACVTPCPPSVHGRHALQHAAALG